MTQFKTLGIDQAKLYACAVILPWGVILRKSFSKPEILCKQHLGLQLLPSMSGISISGYNRQSPT